jgi:hypothetical protein
MSTLKVNRIEPQSGNTITAIGLTVESSSYSSFAVTASYALNGGGGTLDTSSFITAAQTASMTVLSASYSANALTSDTAATASYVSGSILNYPDPDGTTATILRMVSMTSASYAALDPKDPNTFYVII